VIHKVTDRRRVVHYNVIGFASLVTLCGVEDYGDRLCYRNLLPASWRRQVDCMGCLVRAARLTWCGHGSGEVICIDQEYYSRVRRECHRCTLSACAT